ncbi:ankyrin repeat domain-containing protein [Candidatus Babeliales bacterium]|nr:ankyrin repeat domain-containing protein [Candidatus Babeliales bacterium]
MKKKIVLILLVLLVGNNCCGAAKVSWNREGGIWKKVSQPVRQRSKEEQRKLDEDLVHEMYAYMHGNKHDLSGARGLIEQGANVNFSYHGKPLLVAAAEWPNFVAVKLLLEHGACVDIRDCHNDTAVDNAASEGSVEILELLFAHGARCPQHILSYAVWSGKPNVMEFLLKCEKEPCTSRCPSRECGALQLYRAVCFGRIDVVALILRYGLENVHEFFWNGNAPLHEARTERMWALLVQAGADPMQKNKYGKTAQEIWDAGVEERKKSQTCSLQ